MKPPKIRKARISDCPQIQALINGFAGKGIMLPRSLNEIYETLRDHFVAELDGRIIGVCGMHILWEDLAEIRSLAVKKKYHGIGVGRKLVRRCIREARELGIERLFVLTYTPEFFRRLGFREIDKSELPQKIWGDCLRCPKFPDCDETALITET
jgi:amino-acid N-acetyltransferase